MNNSVVPVTTKANEAWRDGEEVGQDGNLSPPSAKINSESMNFYELLEDRNSYQGCNKLLFLFLYFIAVYQVVIQILGLS